LTNQAAYNTATSTVPLFILTGLYLLVQVIGYGILGGYGIFRDEFYYLVNAERLAWGYVDHPPLAPLLLSGVRARLWVNQRWPCDCYQRWLAREQSCWRD
jgi:hypothetical protein